MPAASSGMVVVDALRRVPLFADLPDQELQALAASSRGLTRKRGARIFEEESPADSCYVMMEGRAKVVISGRAGAEVILGFAEPFELVGEVALIDNAPRSAGLVAITDCHLLQISRRAFVQLRRNSRFEDKLLGHITGMLRRATGQLRAISTYSAAERVMWCLARLAAAAGRRDGRTILISPRPSQQEIADMVGCSRETVTRVLGELEAKKSVAASRAGWVLDERVFRPYLDAEQHARTTTTSSLLV